LNAPHHHLAQYHCPHHQRAVNDAIHHGIGMVDTVVDVKVFWTQSTGSIADFKA
jgi:hypothetical protein